MRSQTTNKPLPKKGALKKANVKLTSPSKVTQKKEITAKKVKTVVSKTISKGGQKRNKDEEMLKSNEGTSSSDKNESTQEVTRAGSSRGSLSRSNSPVKKTKTETKEKKCVVKNTISKPKKVVSKKAVKLTKKRGSIMSSTVDLEKDDVKYKLNSDLLKKPAQKYFKAKTSTKKVNLQSKKTTVIHKEKTDLKETNSSEEKLPNKGSSNQDGVDKINRNINNLESSPDKNKEPKLEATSNVTSDVSEPKHSDKKFTSVTSPPGTPKVEAERPPKFFTSSRSPRMVDIDVKCLKTAKGSLSVSERFVTTKYEPKCDNNKDTSASNTLISQGPDIDVYTFTEKVDSPKSVLSDFRNPANKNIGRVRPIARVKGTIINKKSDNEKKKYSPHRPIEEVVKQLKANKKSEELVSNQIETNDMYNIEQSETNNDDTPKPIVSKSYKMVARKSSITGKPFSPIKFLDHDAEPCYGEKNKSSEPALKKPCLKSKKNIDKTSLSDDELDTSKFSFNTKTFHYTSSEESVSESNDDNDTKESSESDTPKSKKTKTKKYKKITDTTKKNKSKELKELSKDSLMDLKDDDLVINEKPSKRRLKLLSLWSGPKKHRMASLNALAKVHCLYENESRTHMELGLMKTVDRHVVPSTSKQVIPKKKEPKFRESDKSDSTSESEYENKNEKKDKSSDNSESSDDNPPQRSLRGDPGIRSAGKYWDPKSSTSSSEDSELESKNKPVDKKKMVRSPSVVKSDTEKPPAKMKKTAGVPVKKKRNRNEVTMDLKDMVVQKRMASLNATAILAASYEKRSPKSSKDDTTTSDSCSDESFSHKSKNGVASGVKSETKIEEPKKEINETESAETKQKVEVIVNQASDVIVTGLYSNHEQHGFCRMSGYMVSTSHHTQTTATSNCEEGCTREDGSRYTPLSALSSMQPPVEHTHGHPHPGPVAELGGLRAAGCSSAFTAPSPSAHHEPGKTTCLCSVCRSLPSSDTYGYYQPAGPLIKESGADADRALARYHPPPHYHPPHPPVMPQYGPAQYYPDLCYRYYRTPPPYHMPQPGGQMVGVGSEPYPPPQYYGTPPCYQHSPQRVPYIEYRGCPCPLNACPKNVLIGPATGKAPTSGGPDVLPALAPPGAAFRKKARVCALDNIPDTHGSGKDPPLEPAPSSVTDVLRPYPVPALGSGSPKREIYDVRDTLRLAGNISGPPGPNGLLSSARGSAGVAAPQPPLVPKRARLGKAMVRRSLVKDDKGLHLLPTQQPPPQQSEADDDVLAISPPVCTPIDLSSSDERSTPLVDVKKENEGPTYSTPRKTDAQALREHNCSTALSESTESNTAAKAVKRRYSKPNLEIEMKDVHLEESLKTNCIGEHVKLQKRRKVSSEQSDVQRIETVTKDQKKKSPSKPKKVPKTPTTGEKKSLKRKLSNALSSPKAKKISTEAIIDDDFRIKNIAAVITEEHLAVKPKIKSALLLDNLIRKNSIDRPDAKGYSSDTELNPAKLFMTPNENISQNTKKILNNNNNVLENNIINSGVRPNTIAAVSQLIEKKLANKNARKIEKIDSKVTQNFMTVLKSTTETPEIKDTCKQLKSESVSEIISSNVTNEKCKSQLDAIKNIGDLNNGKACDTSVNKSSSIETDLQPFPNKTKSIKVVEIVDKGEQSEKASESQCTKDISVKPTEEAQETKVRSEKPKAKRCKLSIDKAEGKGKMVEKVAKLLVSKKLAIKTDEAALCVEDACESPVPSVRVRRAGRRRRSGCTRRPRRTLVPPNPPALQPRQQPRWSNGWRWDGDHYVSKVYLNNDSRLDKVARCWPRMAHANGDRVARGDCVLLRANTARVQPFVARVARLWENPEDGEMMVSLVWYYRPEHTARGRAPEDAPDEVFASRHRDANSVACIEDKCHVLTFNEYCRYRKRLKASEEGVSAAPSIVPPLPASELQSAAAPGDTKLPASISPELVFFCRSIYDFRSKKIQVPNK